MAAVVAAVMVLSSLAVISSVQPSGGTTSDRSAGVSTFIPCSATVDTENGDDNAIQTAINANPGGNICVGPGTFPEQLTISKLRNDPHWFRQQSTIIEPNSRTLTINTYDYDSSGMYLVT